MNNVTINNVGRGFYSRRYKAIKNKRQDLCMPHLLPFSFILMFCLGASKAPPPTGGVCCVFAYILGFIVLPRYGGRRTPALRQYARFYVKP